MNTKNEIRRLLNNGWYAITHSDLEIINLLDNCHSCYIMDQPSSRPNYYEKKLKEIVIISNDQKKQNRIFLRFNKDKIKEN